MIPAGMTSVALAARALPAALPFNVDLFATAATPIPVLFIAIAIQSRTYEDFLQIAHRAKRATMMRHGSAVSGASFGRVIRAHQRARRSER